MNYLQAFAKDEKHIRQLIRVMGNDDCKDCSDAFTHWAMREKPVRKKPLDDRPKNAR